MANEKMKSCVGETQERKGMRYVLIEWFDSKGITTSWEFMDEIQEQKPSLCISVGILIDDKKEFKTIAQSINEEPPDNKQVIGRTTIPSCSILKIKELR